MRVTIEVLRLKATVLHDLSDVGLILRFRHDIMRAHRFADDLADRHTRRKAGVRILEDHLHMRAQRAQLLLGELCKVLPLEHDRTAGHIMQAQDRAADRGLAAAGFAHKAHRRAAFDGEGHIVHSLHESLGPAKGGGVNGIILFEVLYYQEVVVFHFLPPHSLFLPVSASKNTASRSSS